MDETFLGGEAVRLPKTADVIAARVRAVILSRGLKAGTPLRGQRELCEYFKVSPASIREALRLLEAEGLVEVRRGVNGGVFVHAPTTQHVTRALATLLAQSHTPTSALLELRVMLEPEVAALAAERASEMDRDTLAQLVQDGRHPSSADEANFHLRLARLAGNDLAVLVLRVLRDLSAGIRLGCEYPGRASTDDGRDHARIARAIVKGDGPATRRAMQRHLESQIEELGTILDVAEPLVSLPVQSEDALFDV